MIIQGLKYIIAKQSAFALVWLPAIIVAPNVFTDVDAHTLLH